MARWRRPALPSRLNRSAHLVKTVKEVVVRSFLFRYGGMAKGTRSMKVQSQKVPMGRILRRTSRKRRSMAFAVHTGFRSSGVGYRKRAARSSRGHSTAFGQVPVGEAACGAHGGDVRSVHDVMEVAFGVLSVGPPEFVGDIPDPVSPAASALPSLWSHSLHRAILRQEQWGTTMRFQEFVDDQVFSPVLIADALHTTKSEIAGTLGLGRDAFSRTSRIRARKTQTRLRQMLEILNRVEAGTGSPLAAYAWFRAEPLPGFGGATPNLLLREGKADHVHAYLDRVMAGGYA